MLLEKYHFFPFIRLIIITASPFYFHFVQKRVDVNEKALKFGYLDKKDVFIIDLGLTIYRVMYAKMPLACRTGHATTDP